MSARVPGTVGPAEVPAPTPPTEPRTTAAPGDAESEAWLQALRGGGAAREAAVERLHALLLRGARHELRRRQAALGGLPAAELEDMAMHAADDALVAVLAKLDSYRGRSRFTTWAYKFVLLEAAVRARRRIWRDRDVLLDPESWPSFAEPRRVDDDAHTAELLARIREAIRSALTPHQRVVLVALAVDGVPIDVLAERLNTTRGALYKTLHDARAKLRRELAAAGFEQYAAKDGGR